MISPACCASLLCHCILQLLFLHPMELSNMTPQMFLQYELCTPVACKPLCQSDTTSRQPFEGSGDNLFSCVTLIISLEGCLSTGCSPYYHVSYTFVTSSQHRSPLLKLNSASIGKITHSSLLRWTMSHCFLFSDRPDSHQSYTKMYQLHMLKYCLLVFLGWFGK